MTKEEQEIIDILSDKIYVVVEYDTDEFRELLRYGDPQKLINMPNDEVLLHIKLKSITTRMTWGEANVCMMPDSKNKFIAHYKDIRHPILSP